MVIAYLILIHAAPGQAARLISSLPKESPVFIHVDARSGDAIDQDLKALLAHRPKTHFVKRHRCRWGNSGIVRATMELVHALAGSDHAFDYATLLSGADYPIKSNDQIAETLERHRGAEFIESFRLDQPNRWSGHGGLFKTPGRVLNLHVFIRSRVYSTPFRRTLPDGLLPYGGTQWWTLTQGAILAISRYVRQHPAIMRFMKGVFIPDECLIQTVLGALPQAQAIHGDPLRLAVWDRPTPPYPATLKSTDLALMRSSPCLFARKFSDSTDPDVYALIDRELRAA